MTHGDGGDKGNYGPYKMTSKSGKTFRFGCQQHFSSHSAHKQSDKLNLHRGSQYHLSVSSQTVGAFFKRLNFFFFLSVCGRLKTDSMQNTNNHAA